MYLSMTSLVAASAMAASLLSPALDGLAGSVENLVFVKKSEAAAICIARSAVHAPEYRINAEAVCTARETAMIDKNYEYVLSMITTYRDTLSK